MSAGWSATNSRPSLRRRRGGLAGYGQSWAAEIEFLEPRALLSGIVVNATGDTPNYAASVTVGQLNSAVTPVTLRDAIDACNNTSGDVTITFDSNVFPAGKLTTITLGSTLEISQTNGKITIQGPGFGQVTISGNDQHTVFLIDANVNAEIDAIAITNGRGSVESPGIPALCGGGLYNNGTLSLHNDLITKNFTSMSYASGAGVFNLGSITISNCTFSANSTGGFGGAICNEAIMAISDSGISANAAGYLGGGIENGGSATVTNCTVSNNTSSGAGGGIMNFNDMNVINCTLTGNIALNNAGGGFFDSGEVPGVGQATIINSTISGNFAQFGGGIEIDPHPPVQFRSPKLFGTIVAGNMVSARDATPSDYSGPAADPSSSHNLIGQGGSSGLTNGTNGNLVGSAANPIDPHLGPLADNGGPTQTVQLFIGSPAHGAGAIFNDASGNPITVDQRGVFRLPFSVDMGAYQTASADNSFAGEYAVSTNGGPATLASISQNGVNLILNGSTSSAATVISATQLQVGGTTATFGNSVITFGSTGLFANQVWTKLDLPANFTNLQGNPTHVIQDGNSVTFVDKFGNTSVGTWISPTQLSAFGETVTVGTGKLTWSDGSFWYQSLVLTGTRNGVPTTTVGSAPGQFVMFNFDNGHGGTTTVIETGTNKVIFYDAMHRFSLGSFINATQATSDLYPGDVATFSNDSSTVTWQDGYVWTRTTPFSDFDVPTIRDYTNPNGVATHFIENGRSTQAVFVDSQGRFSIGQRVTISQLTDSAYPGDLATFGAGGTLTWLQGNVVWTPTSNPPLVLTATDSTGGVSHLAVQSASTVLGLDGPLQGIIGTRANGQITWSNGDVWADFDDNLLNAFFEMG